MWRNLLEVARARRGGAVVSWRSTTLDSARLARDSRVAHHASVRSCTIGRYTSVGRFAKLAFADIGSFCSISWDVTIGAISHPMTHITTHAFPYVPSLGIAPGARKQDVERVRIGHDVWIGTQAIIMPGVTIGNGAVIGAGSVVTSDVEPYTVVAGVPARKLRDRFPAEVAAQIDALAWWDLPTSELRARLDAFQTDDVAAGIARLKGLPAAAR
ncbi:CatB-related O-acetyltransferase [Microbacterium sp. NPDC096154]|uniref:CatB-related O-acetyltransferase n=1 Tax=Microbacterium sp. NPDC096154 TaxID=3155549 RepID=UPI003329CB90